MKEANDKYEPVIGLEIHIQLLTQSKAFSSDRNEYGAMPNHNVSVVSLGHPGTLPKLNKKAVEFAVRLGLSCKSEIREVNRFARKNYFYADLPKGYQITQYDTPICNGGKVTIKPEKGNEKSINLTRIHLEEDSGKSIHDQDPYDTLVDLNRAGVPLLEMVTEPDLRSSEEAYHFVTEIRRLVRYLEICDGNMEEGSLRCDANVSVRLKGTQAFGRKVEVKNMNSIRNVQRAIEHEIERQVDIIESGGTVNQDTRGFDPIKGTTFSMRTKEMAMDYRYFPEPDLQPLIIKEEFVEQIRQTLPPLPNELFKKYTDHLGLSDYDAAILVDSKEIALYFEEVTKYTNNYKAAANWVMGEVKSYLNENAISINKFPITPENLARLINLIDEGKVSNTIAAKQIYPLMIKDPQKGPQEIAETNNLILESDTGSLINYIKQAIEKYPDKVKEYKAGKKGLVGLFMGEVMKLSKGKADPKQANQLVREMLEEVKI